MKLVTSNPTYDPVFPLTESPCVAELMVKLSSKQCRVAQRLWKMDRKAFWQREELVSAEESLMLDQLMGLGQSWVPLEREE